MGNWNLIIPLIIIGVAGYFLVRMFLKNKKHSEGAISRGVGADVLNRTENHSEPEPHKHSPSISFVDRVEDSIFSFFGSIWEKIVEVGKKYKAKRAQRKKSSMRMRQFEQNRENEKQVFGEKREEKEEKQPRPMISEKVAQPKKRPVVMKEDAQYEEMLVERIAYNPHDVEAYELLGDYYINQRNFEDAKECYKQILKLTPGSRSAKIRIRRLEHILAKDTISR